MPANTTLHTLLNTIFQSQIREGQSRLPIAEEELPPAASFPEDVVTPLRHEARKLVTDGVKLAGLAATGIGLSALLGNVPGSLAATAFVLPVGLYSLGRAGVTFGYKAMAVCGAYALLNDISPLRKRLDTMETFDDAVKILASVANALSYTDNLPMPRRRLQSIADLVNIAREVQAAHDLGCLSRSTASEHPIDESFLDHCYETVNHNSCVILARTGALDVLMNSSEFDAFLSSVPSWKAQNAMAERVVNAHAGYSAIFEPAPVFIGAYETVHKVAQQLLAIESLGGPNAAVYSDEMRKQLTTVADNGATHEVKESYSMPKLSSAEFTVK